jgi:hypothetical protein
VASQLGGKAAIQSMELPDHQLMLQLVTQSAAQPGILTCWLDILALANNSAQFYVAELPAGLEGKPYMDVRRWALQSDAAWNCVPCSLLCVTSRGVGCKMCSTGRTWASSTPLGRHEPLDHGGCHALRAAGRLRRQCCAATGCLTVML